MFKKGQAVKYVGDYLEGVKDVIGYIDGETETKDGFYVVHYPSLPEKFKVNEVACLNDINGCRDKKQYLYIYKTELVAVDVPVEQDRVSEVKFKVGDQVRYIGNSYFKLRDYIGTVVHSQTKLGSVVVYYPSLPNGDYVGDVYLHDCCGIYSEEKYIAILPEALELVNQLEPEFVPKSELEEVKREAKIVYLSKKTSGTKLKRAIRERLYREALIDNWDEINKGTDVLCVNEMCNGATLWSVDDPYIALKEIEKDNPDLEFIVVNSAGQNLSELSLRIKHKPEGLTNRWKIKK